MVISAGTYAYVIASMSSIVASMNVTQSRYYERLNEVNAYMKARDLPASLQLRTRKYLAGGICNRQDHVYRYYRYFLQRKTVYNEASILEDLPTNLKSEVTEHYIKVTIRDVAFFHGTAAALAFDQNTIVLLDLPHGFTTEIAMHLKPTFFPPNSLVLSVRTIVVVWKRMGSGDRWATRLARCLSSPKVRASAIRIGLRSCLGILHVTLLHQETQQEFGIAYLYDGDHFGEMALLLEEQAKKRSANIRSKTYCELHGTRLFWVWDAQ